MGVRRILFISKGERSASTRYRALAFFPYLQDAGWSPEHATAYDGPMQRYRLLRRAAQADVVVVLRKTFSAPFLYLLRRAARTLVFDFDDAIFCRSNGSASRMRMQRFIRMVRLADAIWAGNRYLAEVAQAYGQNVQVLPTSLDPGRYFVPAEKPDDVVDLVWIGSRSTRRYVADALPMLEELAVRLPGMRLKIIADFALHSERLQTLAIPWSADAEAGELASSHIGIAPMTDNAWTRGKCALKVLQYMAAGLPVVASETGVHVDVVEHGRTGFLAARPDQWSAALEKLIRDPSLRGAMGKAAREAVQARFSARATAEQLLAALSAMEART